jgi:DNA-binding transcriptional LysR family regulator
MDLDRVRYFCVIANTSSLQKASEILRISQPALSKAMKILEADVNQELFIREGRSLELSPQGRMLKSQVEPLLEKWLSIPAGLAALQNLSQALRIGSFEVFTTYFLGPLTAEFGERSFELYELTPGHLEEEIRNKRIDLGITYLPISKPNVNFTEAARIRMGLFARHGAFHSTSFEHLPFAIPTSDMIEGAPSKVMGLDGWPDHKIPRKVSFRVTMMESALELCRLGRAVSYLPEFIVKLHNKQVNPSFKLVELPCPVSAKERWQSVYVVHHAHNLESKDIRSVAKVLRALKT